MNIDELVSEMARPPTPPDDESHINPLQTQRLHPLAPTTYNAHPPPEPSKLVHKRIRALRRRSAQRGRRGSDKIPPPPLFSQKLPSPPRRRGRSPTERKSTSQDDFDIFMNMVDFTLTFYSVDYPRWATDPNGPLPYKPVPLMLLPGIPLIPGQLRIPFGQMLDQELFACTIDGLLNANGYPAVSQHDVWKVYVRFPHWNGQRAYIPTSMDNIHLVLMPWAKEAFRGGLPLGRREVCDNQSLVHLLDIMIVFPQWTENMCTRRMRDTEICGSLNPNMWAGKEKLPADHTAGAGVRRIVGFGMGEAMPIRFNAGEAKSTQSKTEETTPVDFKMGEAEPIKFEKNEVKSDDIKMGDSKSIFF